MATIPKPKHCDQDWLRMKPVDGGKLCGKCGHTLQDFTKKTWAEIEIIQQENQNSVCGMYTNRQLEFWGNELPITKSKANFIVAASLIFAPILTYNKEAKAQHNSVQQQVNSEKEAIAVAITNSLPDTSNLVIIKGKVIDKITKEPIPFANVFLKNNEQQVGYSQTDINGLFLIKANLSKDAVANAILEFITIGYDHGKSSLTSFPDFKNIIAELIYYKEVMAGATFTVREPSLWRKVKYKIGSWFQKD